MYIVLVPKIIRNSLTPSHRFCMLIQSCRQSPVCLGEIVVAGNRHSEVARLVAHHFNTPFLSTLQVPFPLLSLPLRSYLESFVIAESVLFEHKNIHIDITALCQQSKFSTDLHLHQRKHYRPTRIEHKPPLDPSASQSAPSQPCASTYYRPHCSPYSLSH